MSPPIRKLALIAHLTSSVGWIGAVLAYIALGLSAATSQDQDTVRAAWISMEITGWYVLVPLAIGSFVTGVVMSLGTPWGLFRHYWVLVSLLLTVFCTVILILHMPAVSATSTALRAGAHSGHTAGGDLFHPTAGLIILVAIMALNVFKPRGLTPYGWRKLQEERALAKAHTPPDD